MSDEQQIRLQRKIDRLKQQADAQRKRVQPLTPADFERQKYELPPAGRRAS